MRDLLRTSRPIVGAFNATVSWMAPTGLFLIQYTTMRHVVRRNIGAWMSQAAPAE